MRICKDYGIAHSVFLEWSGEDQAKALAYLFEEAERCQMCGTADWEWQENRSAYEPVLTTCLGCYYKEIAREGQEVGAGVTVRLERPGTMQAAQRAVAQTRLARRDRDATRRQQQGKAVAQAKSRARVAKPEAVAEVTVR